VTQTRALESEVWLLVNMYLRGGLWGHHGQTKIYGHLSLLEGQALCATCSVQCPYLQRQSHQGPVQQVSKAVEPSWWVLLQVQVL
jgi:hypothetical protein